MAQPVITAEPGMSVANARQLMWTNNIRHLPVMQNDRIIGMLSERDVHTVDHSAAVVLSSQQRALLTGAYRSVRTVMMTAVQTVWPHDTMVYAASVMAQWKIGALPVVEQDRLVGIITTTDCLRALVALHHSIANESMSAD
jgi:acetoin utilization protein AcuB